MTEDDELALAFFTMLELDGEHMMKPRSDIGRRVVIEADAGSVGGTVEDETDDWYVVRFDDTPNQRNTVNRRDLGKHVKWEKDK